MKITIVVGGRWHAFDLARELYQAGHLHKLITNYPRWMTKRWGIPADRVVSLPLTFWVVRMIYMIGGESLMMRCQWHVHQWFAKRAVPHLKGSELIHGWSQWSQPSLEWAQMRGVPTVLERSSAQIEEQSRLLREEHARLGLKWAPTHPRIEEMELQEYGLSSTIAVPSMFVERSFQQRGVPTTKLYRNALGVDLSHFQPSATPPPHPEESGLRAIYAGSLSVRKGIPDLLEGWRKAGLKHSQLTLVGGQTPEMASLLAAQPSNVRAIGHRPQAELVDHYGQAHCFVLASIEEGMAMVQMQALACGLPLICTRNTGGEDLLRMQGDEAIAGPMDILCFPAGYVVPIHNPQAIAWCLQQLPEGWEQKRRAALVLAKSNLSWCAYGRRAVKLYESLIK